MGVLSGCVEMEEGELAGDTDQKSIALSLFLTYGFSDAST